LLMGRRIVMNILMVRYIDVGIDSRLRTFVYP